MNRKELKEKYKQLKTEMGVFAYKCLPSGKTYLGYSQNIKADINSITFQLKLGSYPTNSHLQNDWQKYGADQFEITVVELLQYDKDETKTDYSNDLRLLRRMCAEKITDAEFINY